MLNTSTSSPGHFPPSSETPVGHSRGASGGHRSARVEPRCWCRGCRDLRCSQRGVDHSVDVSAERLRVHRRQLRPPFDEHVDREGLTSKGHKKSDGLAVSSYGQPFTVSDTVDHFPTVVAKISNRYLIHHPAQCITRDTHVRARRGRRYTAVSCSSRQIVGCVGLLVIDLGEERDHLSCPLHADRVCVRLPKARYLRERRC